MNYENPRYGKWIQKLNRMGPEQKAIFDIGAVAAMKGRDDIKTTIEALNKEASQMGQATSRKAVTKDYEFRKQALEDEEKLKPFAHGLGAVSLASGILSGYNRLRRENRRASFFNELLNGVTTD